MNREKAIDLLDNLIGMVEDNQESDYDTALKMAIQALSQESTDENLHREREQAYMQGYEDASKRFRQEPCDAISRQALLKDLYQYKISCAGRIQAAILEVEELVEKMPSVTPQQKYGKWTLMYEPKNMVVCSECGKCAYMYQDKTSAFCPNCGVRMVEPPESEDKE